jgi:FAD/FMN-containing dehydrogenase
MRGMETGQFQQTLRGRLITRDDPDYDDARALYNGMIDKRPLLIARCVDVADVVAAVNFGRDNGFPVAVRGGGHNGPGLGGVDDGLVIDLSAMKSVRVNPSTVTTLRGSQPSRRNTTRPICFASIKTLSPLLECRPA